MASLLSKILAFADRAKPESQRNARYGENLAYEYLKKKGFEIVARNYQATRTRGEVDLFAYDDDYLVCIEVKTRKNNDFGRPEAFVTREKKRHLIQTAKEYAGRVGWNLLHIRYDIVSVTLEPTVEVEHFRGAFNG